MRHPPGALAADAAIPSRPFVEMIYSALCADYAVAEEWADAYTHARAALAHRRYTALYLGLTRWCETEALLRGGDVELARADATRFTAMLEDHDDDAISPRFQIPARRCRAVLARWEGNAAQTIAHLEAASALATTLELPGEQWPLLAALATYYEVAGQPERARHTRDQAADVIDHLANQIDDADLREQFVVAASASIARTPVTYSLSRSDEGHKG